MWLVSLQTETRFISIAANLEEFSCIFKTSEKNVTLRKINLSHTNGLNKSYACVIVKFLTTNTTLTELNLSCNNYIGDTGVSRNITLQVLNLMKNGIRNDGSIVIATVLSTNSALIKLYLNRNNIGNVGATDIASALSTKTTLLTLDLSHNYKIEKTGMTEIIH